jgi:16S rRNA (uracil1498-N3)-methyltransferase
MFFPDEWGRPLPAGDERSLHIRDILRLGAGDELRVGIIGSGPGTGMGVARLAEKPGGGELLLEFPPAATLVPREGPPITLIIGHPRPPVFQRLLRDLSCMGIRRINWVRAELSEKSYLASRAWEQDQIRRHIRLGLEQGGFSRPPEIEKYYSLSRCLEGGFSRRSGGNSRRILLHNGSDAPTLLELAGGMGSPPDVTLAIGPERGWTERELKDFQERGFESAVLGDAVLRTETAATVAAGLLSMI